MPAPKKNATYSFYLALVDSANSPAFKANPSLSSGDFKSSLDGGAFGNLATLPVVSPGSSVAVLVALSAAEMNGGNIVIYAHDPDGEWDDVFVALQPETPKFQKAQALLAFEFTMVQAANHVTAATGLSVTGQVSLDGASFAALTNAISEVGSGIYKVDLAAADLNGDVLTLRFSATGADDRVITILTVS